MSNAYICRLLGSCVHTLEIYILLLHILVRIISKLLCLALLINLSSLIIKIENGPSID